MEGTNTPLGCGGDDHESKEVSNEKDDVYAEQSDRIKMIISSYDDTNSEDSDINSESDDETSLRFEVFSLAKPWTFD